MKVSLYLEFSANDIHQSFTSISDAVDFLEAYKEQSIDDSVEEIRQYEAGLIAKGANVVEEIKEFNKKI